MNIIDEFQIRYGAEVLESLQITICEDNLSEEFEQAFKNLPELLKFAIKYGFYPLVEYLYITKEIPYDLNLITTYVQCLHSESNASFAQAETSSGVNTGLHIMKMDKYTENRNTCINFLLAMKKYSIYTPINKQYLYRFNPRYLSVLE